ncbi:hypothetical protein DAI22_03g414500 [Oryza sativa Japonica Group]|nr:hypothetical protein DAI22_03g414500 [Oryza sativa Japonica Group]
MGHATHDGVEPGGGPGRGDKLDLGDGHTVDPGQEDPRHGIIEHRGVELHSARDGAGPQPQRRLREHHPRRGYGARAPLSSVIVSHGLEPTAEEKPEARRGRSSGDATEPSPPRAADFAEKREMRKRKEREKEGGGRGGQADMWGPRGSHADSAATSDKTGPLTPPPHAQSPPAAAAFSLPPPPPSPSPFSLKASVPAAAARRVEALMQRSARATETTHGVATSEGTAYRRWRLETANNAVADGGSFRRGCVAFVGCCCSLPRSDRCNCARLSPFVT